MRRSRSVRGTLAAVLTLAALAVVVPLAIPASAGGSCAEEKTEKPGKTVGMTEGCFTPTVIHVSPGDTVTFSNTSGVEHAVVGSGHSFGEDLPPGATMSVAFDEPGVFPYFCHVHLGMIGAVVVGDAAAVSTSAGSGSSGSGSGSGTAAGEGSAAGSSAGDVVPASDSSRGVSTGTVLIGAIAAVFAAAAGFALGTGRRRTRRVAGTIG